MRMMVTPVPQSAKPAAPKDGAEPAPRKAASGPNLEAPAPAVAEGA